MQARCNHSHKHQSIVGVKEQGVCLSTLTAEYPPSLALQLAQIGVGRVSKTGSFRQALPLQSNSPRTVTLAPCRLPTCDGAGMRSSADWCLPKPDHPLQAVARSWLRCTRVQTRATYPGTHPKRFFRMPAVALRKPGSGNSSVYRFTTALPFRHEPRGRTAIPTPLAACPGQILG